MFKLKISPAVREDLADIKRYITEELSNPDAALSITAKIIKQIRSAAQFPERGAPLSSVISLQTDYRFLIRESYLIFYRCEGDTVYVTRVIYQKRDYAQILFGISKEE